MILSHSIEMRRVRVFLLLLLLSFINSIYLSESVCWNSSCASDVSINPIICFCFPFCSLLPFIVPSKLCLTKNSMFTHSTPVHSNPLSFCRFVYSKKKLKLEQTLTKLSFPQQVFRHFTCANNARFIDELCQKFLYVKCLDQKCFRAKWFGRLEKFCAYKKLEVKQVNLVNYFWHEHKSKK